MSCTCQQCGRKYKHDFLVDYKIWKQITPKSGEAGMLCGNCIVDKLEGLQEYRVWQIEGNIE